MVLQFENHALARRKALHRFLDVAAKFLSEKLFFRIGARAQFRLAIEEIGRHSPVLFRQSGRLFFAASGAAAQVIEGHVGHNPIEPGIETALEPEAMQIAIGAQEAFLINVARIFRTMHQIQRQAENIAVVTADEFLKRQAIAGLSFTDEALLLRKPRRRCLARISVECDAVE